MNSAKITLSAGDIDLEKIIKYRPFFLFWDDSKETQINYNLKRINLKFEQKGKEIIVGINSTKELKDSEIEDIKNRLEYCLGVKENYDKFYVMIEHDSVLKNFTDKIEGNRIISAFNDFDAVLAIICSQNVTFNQYKKMIKQIINVYGIFPSPLDILKNPEGLKKAGVGYRDKYIIEAAKKFRFSKSISLEELSKIKGIGDYSLNIFNLFQKRKWGSFYVDTLIKKIFRENYGFKGEKDKDARKFANDLFNGYSGMAEVYLQKFLNDN